MNCLRWPLHANLDHHQCSTALQGSVSTPTLQRAQTANRSCQTPQTQLTTLSRSSASSPPSTLAAALPSLSSLLLRLLRLLKLLLYLILSTRYSTVLSSLNGEPCRVRACHVYCNCKHQGSGSVSRLFNNWQPPSSMSEVSWPGQAGPTSSYCNKLPAANADGFRTDATWSICL